MTSPVTTMTTAGSPTTGAADSGRDAGYVRKAWRAYWDWRARRLTVMMLSSLDARTLHDIGISPSEIESLVRCSAGRRRRYDAGWVWRCDA
jgi:uncharacterized protein YjiS (DUF1127 family)